MSKSIRRIWTDGRSKSMESRTSDGRLRQPAEFRLVRHPRFLQKWRMSSLVKVAIHASQVPDRVRRDLIESLRTRRINPKFHYDSLKQTGKRLALREAYSPARTDPDCA